MGFSRHISPYAPNAVSYQTVVVMRPRCGGARWSWLGPRCEHQSGGVTHDERCMLLLFSHAKMPDEVEDLDLVLQLDGKASVPRATTEGRRGVEGSGNGER
jgi:hypothetical protein